MKKILCFLLIIIMLFSCACVKPPEESQVSEEESTQEPVYESEGVYQNGVLTQNEPDYTQDVKTISKDGENYIYTDYPNGYRFSFPQKYQLELDFSISENSMTFLSDEIKIRISRENTNYPFVEYMEGYVCNYLESDEYLSLNNIYEKRDNYCQKYGLMSLEHEGVSYPGYGKINERYAKFNFITRNTSGSDLIRNCYAFVNIRVENSLFFNIMINVTDFDKYINLIHLILDSFDVIAVKGINVPTAVYEPVLPDWNQETADFYQRLSSQEGIAWGLMSPRSEIDYYHVNEIEEQIDYNFPTLMFYREISSDFPLEELQRAYDERGQVAVLTLHLLSQGNGDSYAKNNTFGILDGNYDAYIKKWAEGMKAFGHPVMLRCSNEMNTTWCRYSGVQLLCDPDLYVTLWRRVYDIFKAEGVDNAIWIFNPFDTDFPPLNWNNTLAYYPGNEYVQLIGLTAYSSGDYYQYEDFRTFKECYEPLVQKNRQYFSAFPWVIGEFGCSSVGGDKNQWIQDMFAYFPDYPEIKLAIWYSYADYDEQRYPKLPARPFWLEEKEEYLISFAEGVKKGWAIDSLIN